VLYVMVYGCTFFFQNFGANPTTYIIPSVVYSTAHRATCHGVSAAAGKLGALIGAQVRHHGIMSSYPLFSHMLLSSRPCCICSEPSAAMIVAMTTKTPGLTSIAASK
jgi:hypothetical protein